MKKALFIIFGLVVVSLFVWVRLNDRTASGNSPVVGITQPPGENVNSNTPSPLDVMESIFVTYWGIRDEILSSSYSELYYFGITFDENGDLVSDEGFSRLGNFKNRVGSKKSYLVIRLINNDVNRKILEESALRKNVITSSISVMRDYSFDGILLDLEMSGLGFDSTEKAITSFIQEFSGEVKNQNKTFYTALYGDTYYRARPYSVKEIGKVSDKIVIMTYDFHKARGKPGPNFPFEKGRAYPYDFKMMIEDFKKDVEIEKIEITFGMFGYDWGTNDQEMATSYSYNKIKQDFLKNCIKADCEERTDQNTKEGFVEYEEEGIKHSVWFETPESITIKKQYAQQQGISHFSYWAYSYF